MTARSTQGHRPEGWAIALAALSAFAAGTHEVAWSRLLARAVGNSAFGIGLTLGIFMFGLGAGTLLAPRLRRMWRAPLLGFGMAEISIALLSIALVVYCGHAPLPSSLVPIDGAASLALDVAIASAVAFAPALAMGTSYPFLVEASARGAPAIYAAGLAGAVLGTLACATWIGPAIGLDAASALAAAINLSIGAFALQVRKRREGGPRPASLRPEDREAALRFAAAGAIGLGAQIVWNRCLVPYAGSAGFTFAAIVAVYLAAQSLGFAAYARLPREGVARIALALAAPVSLLALDVSTILGVELPDRDDAPLAWMAAVLGVVSIAVAPGALLLGASQAGALDRIEHGEGGLGRRASIAVGWGTIAAAASALVVSLALVPSIGPRASIAVLALAAALVLARGASPIDRAIVGAALLGAVALTVRPLGAPHFLGSAFDSAPVLYAEHGVQDTTAVITVDQPMEPRIRRLVANGVSYSGDSIFAQRYMRLLAHLPAQAAPGRERALVVCVGTGTTLDALARHPFRRIDAVDISPSVRRTLRFFEGVNHRAQEDPRVSLVIDDGARFLRRTAHRYDLITLEPPPPRAPSASSLYSTEFYRSARARLRPGGAIAQWLPLHGLSSEEAQAVVRTFADVFENVSLHYAERNEAILVGVHGEPDRRAFEPTDDLASIGFPPGIDPWDDTIVLEGAALRAIATGEEIRDARPLPEQTGLFGALPSTPIDRFSTRVAQVVDRSDTSGAAFARAAPLVVRVQEGRARENDARAASAILLGLLASRPDDPYLQHAFGYGALLEARIGRLTALDGEERRALRARIAAQRARILRMLGR